MLIPTLLLPLLTTLALATPAQNKHKTTRTPKPTKSCTKTQCIDYINSCGQTYGGCFPACGHHVTTPVFTDPGCPTPTCTRTQCVDYINDCGQTYGGCFPACKGYTTPSFTDPGCPSSEGAGTTTCLTGITTPSVTLTSSSSSSYSSSTVCQQSLCVDYINDCGIWYGGCYCADPGRPVPTYTDPGCPSSSASGVFTTV